MPHASGSFLDMLYADNEGAYTQTQLPNTEIPQGDASEDKEPTPTSKKRSRAPKQKMKSKKKGGTRSKNPTQQEESLEEEEATKRGPNWKEHWIVNLIHLRGKMNDKFSGMKKQGNFTHILHHLNSCHF